jgi:hypothetical protein
MALSGRGETTSIIEIVKMADSKHTPFWEDEPLIGGGEIFSNLAERRGTTLFLGKFTMNEIFAVMAKKGFDKEARKRGLWPLAFDMDSSAFPLQRFQIFLREKKPDNLIVDLKIREGIFAPKENPALALPLRDFKSLIMEWLTLQNPAAEFSEKRGSLPGQQHPGLGMSKKIMDIFIYLGKLTRKDCILAFPAFYHNAVLFSRYFHFFNPVKEGEIQSIRRTFSHVPIRHLAWVVHLNCLRTGSGKLYEWKSEEQVFPLTKELKDYFDSRVYKESVRQGLKNSVFVIDEEAFDKKIGSID